MADAFDVAWRGVKQFDGAIDRITLNMQKAALVGGAAAGRELARVASVEAPRVTGNLAGSMEVVTRRYQGTPQTLVGPDGTKAPYARRVDLGYKGLTRKGKQKRKGVYVDGTRVGYTTRGRTPTRANNYFGRAYDKALPLMEATFRRAFAAAIRKS